jgi:hypothetical protein
LTSAKVGEAVGPKTDSTEIKPGGVSLQRPLQQMKGRNVMRKGNDMKSVKKLIATAAAIACFIVATIVLTRGSGLAATHAREQLRRQEFQERDRREEGNANTQIAELYQVQAAFHQAASGAGVSAAAKAQHLSDMLALWTDDGTLVVGSTAYTGKGNPGTPSCDPGSLTLCDFFANHAGSFVLGRDWVSLTPSFKTSIDVHGHTADLFFECHYFDVPTGLKKSDVSYGLRGNPSSGQARKVNGQWLLWYAVVGFPPLSSQ